jgi:hypothetical protein
LGIGELYTTNDLLPAVVAAAGRSGARKGF